LNKEPRNGTSSRPRADPDRIHRTCTCSAQEGAHLALPSRTQARPACRLPPRADDRRPRRRSWLAAERREGWDGEETAEGLIERTDRALYAAKRAGRARAVVDERGAPNPT